MKKIQVILIVLGLLAGVAAAYAIQGWDPYRAIPQVTLTRLNQSESAWYAAGILDYDAVVSVEFSSERRQYEVSVRGGQLVSARSARYDDQVGAWGPFSDTPDEEAAFFTIPGIFATVRSALLNEQVSREVLRMSVDEMLGFPAQVFLGRIFEDGFPVDGTELLLEVVAFERK